MFLAQKTQAFCETGTVSLVVASCGLNFAEATHRLSRLEFKVEIKPELLGTSPSYQFYLCRGPRYVFFHGFFMALARPFAPCHLLGCWERVDPGSTACLQLRRVLRSGRG